MYGVTTMRPPKINKFARKMNEKEIKKLYELSSMRVWTLKKKLLDRIKETKE